MAQRVDERAAGQRRYLQAMGITVWERRTCADRGGARAPSPEQREARLAALAREAGACRACALHEARRHVVFGTGAANARCMFVGEAPGADEDRQGVPFVGRAGRLLNAMLAAVGLAREEVYIANVLKCRPPRNRDPLPEESARCIPFLEQQVALVAPSLLVAVGRIAAHHLLGVSEPLSRLRGRVHEYRPTGTPLLVTFHPAYLLRNPADKRRAWEDLKAIRAALAEGGR